MPALKRIPQALVVPPRCHAPPLSYLSPGQCGELGLDVPEQGTGIDKGTGAWRVQSRLWDGRWCSSGWSWGQREVAGEPSWDIAVMNKIQSSGCGEVSLGDWGSLGRANVSRPDFLQHKF